METVIQVLNSVIDFIGDETRQGALAIIGSIIVAIVFAGWGFWKEKKRVLRVSQQRNLGSKFDSAPNSSGNITLTIEEYDRRLRQREEELIEKIQSSVGEEREAFQAQKDELVERLGNIQSSYENAVSKIRELEEALSKAGEDINEQRITSAMVALHGGDSTLALEIFNEVEDALEPALKRAAEAAYGKGLIAEERVDWREAAKNFQRSVSLYPTELNLYQAGVYLWRSGFYLPGLFVSRQHIELIENRYGRRSSEYAGALSNLAAQLYELREVDEAIDKFEESLSIQRSLGFGSSMDYACSKSNLANVYVLEGKIETAERMLREALEIAKVAPDCDTERLTSMKNGLAEALRFSGNFEESETLFKQVICEDLEEFGSDHPHHARDLHFYSKLLRDMKRYDEAKSLLYTAIRIARRVMGEHHPNTFAIADHFAWILRTTEPSEDDLKMLRDLEGIFGFEIGLNDDECSGGDDDSRDQKA